MSRKDLIIVGTLLMLILVISGCNKARMSVSVISNPPGADILIDGQNCCDAFGSPYGKTSLTNNYQIIVLNYKENITLRLTKDNLVYAENLRFNPGGIKTVNATLSASACGDKTCDVGETPLNCPADCFSEYCKQNYFKIAFVLLAKDSSELTADRLNRMNILRNNLDEDFFSATRGLANMDTSYNVVTLIADNILVSANNEINLQAVTNRFYQTNPDDFDFIVVYSAFNQLPHGGTTTYYYTVKNRINGTGEVIMDLTSVYGSKGRLLGVSSLGNIDMYTDWTLQNLRSNMALHEIGHQWCCYVGDNFAANPAKKLEIMQQGQHEYGGLSSPYGNLTAMGANVWVSNNQGTYTRSDAPGIVWYHPFMLYYMGLLPQSGYDTKYNVYNAGGGDSGNPFVTIAPLYKQVSIRDIIAVAGERTCYTPVCGNGVCDLLENANNCQKDCLCGTNLVSNLTLETDLTTDKDIDCLNITQYNFILDCKGHSIVNSGSASTGAGIRIYLSHPNNILIKNCNISNFYYGITNFNRSTLIDNISIQRNNLNNNKYGLYLKTTPQGDGIRSVIISGNDISNNQFEGIHIGYPLDPSRSSNIKIMNNSIHNNPLNSNISSSIPSIDLSKNYWGTTSCNSIRSGITPNTLAFDPILSIAFDMNSFTTCN